MCQLFSNYWFLFIERERIPTVVVIINKQQQQKQHWKDKEKAKKASLLFFSTFFWTFVVAVAAAVVAVAAAVVAAVVAAVCSSPGFSNSRFKWASLRRIEETKTILKKVYRISILKLRRYSVFFYRRFNCYFQGHLKFIIKNTQLELIIKKIFSSVNVAFVGKFYATKYLSITKPFKSN